MVGKVLGRGNDLRVCGEKSIGRFGEKRKGKNERMGRMEEGEEMEKDSRVRNRVKCSGGNKGRLGYSVILEGFLLGYFVNLIKANW